LGGQVILLTPGGQTRQRSAGRGAARSASASLSRGTPPSIPAPSPHPGFDPEVYVLRFLLAFTRGAVSLADGQRL